jgi:tetratricopeptide (TPR) repeat protein
MHTKSDTNIDDLRTSTGHTHLNRFSLRMLSMTGLMIFAVLILPSIAIADDAFDAANEGNRILDSAYKILNKPGAENPKELWREAIRHYTRSIELGGIQQMGVLYDNRGMCYGLLDDYESALQDYSRALEITHQKDRLGIYGHRAYAYWRLNKYSLAIRDINAAIPLAPDGYYYLHALRGDTQLAIGRYESALKDYTEALRRGAPKHQIIHSRGLVYMRQGNTQQALENFEKAIQIKPRFKASYLSRAALFLSNGYGNYAAKDAEEEVNRTGKLDSTSQYVIICGYFGYLQNGHEDKALQLLLAARDKAESSSINFHGIRYLLTEITEQMLSNQAENLCDKTFVQTVIGMRMSLEGDRTQAMKHLRWVIKSGCQGSACPCIALAEYKRLSDSSIK